MGSDSTKRRARKKKKRPDVWGAQKLSDGTEAEARGGDAGAKGRAKAQPPRQSEPRGTGMTGRAWVLLSLAVLLLATFLRVYDLELKPMHHDEGVNGFFLTNLVRDGVYRYDPSNYHGPTLYFLSLPFVLAMGLKTFAVRLVTVLFGVGTVGLALCLRRQLGAVGALSAAALIAVSPGAVYYSRYFIHESLFVFFTLGVVAAAVWFHDTREAKFLMLASASAALLFATKETAFISAGVLILATVLAWDYVHFTRGWSEGADGQRVLGALRSRLGDGQRASRLLAVAAALFLFLNVLFYSSFFTYPKGVLGAIETFNIWSKTGAKEHAKSFATYVRWLFQEESLLFVLAVAGAAAALFQRRKNRFAVFAGAWAFGLLAAYSLIPYKTPWLMLSFTVPMALSAGYAVQVLDEWTPRWRHVPAIVVMAAALSLGLWQTWVLNFQEYDNDSYIYVYAHSRRDLLRLVGEIDRIAESSGKGRDLRIHVSSPDYWPLPWYLNDYKNAGFVGQLAASYNEDVVVGKDQQEPQLRSALGDNYVKVGPTYALRPGVNLVLYARRDVAGQ